jgi:hypothetical protein
MGLAIEVMADVVYAILYVVGDLSDLLEPVQLLLVVGFCCSLEFVEKCLLLEN